MTADWYSLATWTYSHYFNGSDFACGIAYANGWRPPFESRVMCVSIGYYVGSPRFKAFPSTFKFYIDHTKPKCPNCLANLPTEARIGRLLGEWGEKAKEDRG